MKCREWLEGPRIWVDDDPSGVFWVSDGFTRMAGAVKQRACTRFYHGVSRQCEKLVNRYLRDLVPIPKGATVLNIGANIGEVSAVLATQGASVIALEADPNVLTALAANSREYNFSVEPVAVWREDGSLAMYVATATADTSVFNASDQVIQVDAMRIDTVVQRHRLSRIHLIIGDVEGSEPEALQGASETLLNTDYVSLCASAERSGVRTLEDCEALLKESGFEILFREETGFCTLIARRM